MNPSTVPKHPGIASRLEAFIAEKADNPRQFALAAGLTPQVISHLLQGKAVPGGDTLTALVSKWPSFNATWLLTGRGPMYIDGTAATVAHAKPAGNATLAVSYPTPEEYRQLQEENRQLREQLAANDGKLSAVEEDRNWLRQLVKKDEASADAASLLDTVDEIAREYRFAAQVEVPEIARFVKPKRTAPVVEPVGFRLGVA